jgi:hypothetical protein
MIKTIEIKEWYNKKDILEKYPISDTTYKKKIQKLKDIEYAPYTKMIDKEIQNSNLKVIKERIIHHSVLDDLFGDIRMPNKNQIKKLKKWVRNSKWGWFCNIVPSKGTILDNKEKINYFFVLLRKELKNTSGITMFYSIEKNSKDEYYHTHFLLYFNEHEIKKETITSLLKIVCDDEENKQRIFCEEYNYKVFLDSGKDYTHKLDNCFGYDVLKYVY